jgi:hypothetical protein
VIAMVKKKKKVVKKEKKAVRKRAKAKVQTKVKVIKEKVLGKVDHFFDHLSVAAIKVLSPFKVGDMIHLKGHTTDFVQRVESMQIEHQAVTKVKKGDDVGIKVAQKVREHDGLFLSKAKQPTATIPTTQTAPPAPIKTESKPNNYSGTKFLSF